MFSQFIQSLGFQVKSSYPCNGVIIIIIIEMFFQKLIISSKPSENVMVLLLLLLHCFFQKLTISSKPSYPTPKKKSPFLCLCVL